MGLRRLHGWVFGMGLGGVFRFRDGRELERGIAFGSLYSHMISFVVLCVQCRIRDGDGKVTSMKSIVEWRRWGNGMDDGFPDC